MQAPAQHQIIPKLVHRRRGVQKDDGGDEDWQMVVVPGAVGAQDVAGDEEQRGPGVDPGYLPGVVPEGLVGVKGAGDEEEGGEGDRGALVGGVEPEAAGDCRSECEKTREVRRQVAYLPYCPSSMAGFEER
jgi:hypothetical protein